MLWHAKQTSRNATERQCFKICDSIEDGQDPYPTIDDGPDPDTTIEDGPDQDPYLESKQPKFFTQYYAEST